MIKCPWNRKDKCGPLQKIGLRCPCDLDTLKVLEKQQPISYRNALQEIFGSIERSSKQFDYICPKTGINIRSCCAITQCKWNVFCKDFNNCLLLLMENGNKLMEPEYISEISGVDENRVNEVLGKIEKKSEVTSECRRRKKRTEIQRYFVDWGQKYPPELEKIAGQANLLIHDLT